MSQLGGGLAFPLGVDQRGAIAIARGETDIEQAIAIILSTAPGERPMRPEFGCDIHDHIFEVLDPSAFGAIESAVRAAIERWEPRVTVEGVDFDLGGSRRGLHEHRPDVLDPRRARRAQPRAPLLHHPPGAGRPRRSSTRRSRHGEAAGDPARRSRLPGARVRGAHPDHAALPGVDRAQRLRSRHHADRAVRVDDGDDELPAQPRAGQDLHQPARAARRRAAPADAGARARALHAGGAARRADHDRGRRDRCRHGPHGPRGVRRLRGRRDAHDRAAAPGRLRRRTATGSSATSRWTPASRDPSDPTAPRSRGARSTATRFTSASRSRCRSCCCSCRSTPIPRAAPASTRAARRCAGRWRRASCRRGALVWERVTVLDDTTGGFNFGSGEVLLELPSTASGCRSRVAGCTGCAAASRRARRPARRRTSARPRSRRSPPCRSARRSRPSTPSTSTTRCSARATARRASPSPSCARRCSRHPRTSGSRCATRASALGALGGARVVRGLRSRGPRLRLRLRRPARSSSLPPCVRPTTAGAITAPCRRRARSCACRATASAAGCAATSRRAR